MSKRRKPAQQTPQERPLADKEAPAAVEGQLLGNLVAQAELRSDTGEHAAGSAAADLAHRASLALRVPPGDVARTDTLVDLVARSHLPEARRAVIAERLRGDQALASDIASAVHSALGVDTPDARGPLIQILDAAVELAEAGQLPGAGPPDVRVGAWVAAQVPGVTAETASTLLGALARRFRLGWDEEEDEAPPGDYAAEESGR